MHPEEAPVGRVAEQLEQRFGRPPSTALVLGSGLGVVVDRMDVADRIPSDDLGLPRATVSGHAGEVIRGSLGGSDVLVLSGRVHLYEGYSVQEAVRFVRAIHRWGVDRVLFTCSAGGITPGLEPGDLVAITDHINLMGDNPLRGALWGETRFPDLTRAYSESMRVALLDVAAEHGVPMHQGIYAAMPGPAYETPAEVRMLRTLGADVVGMSTVPEMIAAAQTGLEATALALVSNRAAGLSSTPLTHEEVTEIAGKAAGRVVKVLEAACARF